MSKTPMDAFMVGQFVMQARERTWEGEANPFALGGAATVVRGDRSYMYEPFEIVAVDLPQLVLRRLRPLWHGAKPDTSIVNVTEFDLKIMSPEFVKAWLDGKEQPR
jgi:hypothetical protein